MNTKLRSKQRSNMTQETEQFLQDEQEAAEAYSNSLADLTVNSKPLINSLTMLAEDYASYPKTITNVVESYLLKVPGEVKLPVLYLIDSIIKNIGDRYIPLFAENLVETFSSVFQEVDEKTRAQMYKLRQTWHNFFSNEKLYMLDKKINSIDPHWPVVGGPPAPVPSPVPATTPPVTVPVTAPVTAPVISTKIHLNPLFLKTKGGARVAKTEETPVAERVPTEAEMREELLKKKRGLRQLVREKEKLEELMSKKLSRHEQKLEELQSQLTAAKQKSAENIAKKMAQSKETPKPVISEKAAVADEALSRRLAPAVEPAATGNLTRIAPVNSALVNAVLSRDPRLAGRQGSPPGSVSVEQPSDNRAVSKISVKDPRLTKTESDMTERTKKSSKAKSESPKTKKSSRSSSRPSPERERSIRNKKSLSHSNKRRSNDSPRKEKRIYASRSKEKAVARPITHLEEDSDPGDQNDKEKPASPQPPPPPPPPVISDKGKSEWSVSYVKGSLKGRNYVRRNDREESPDVPPPPAATGAPPEKQPRLADKKGLEDAAVADKTTVPIVPTTGKCVGSTPAVASPTPSKDSLKDVDLRLVTSPTKKRLPTEPEDTVEPPLKKSKAAVMDLLFGDEDVDLRTLSLPVATPVTVPVVPVNKAPPSPPPPPKISREARDTPSPPLRSPRERDAVENQPPHGWAKYKQTRSPMTPHSYMRQREHPSPSEYGRSARQNVDRLGRPLLYHRISESSTDREASDVLAGEDTDMRQPLMRSIDDVRLQDIHKHAAEQLNNGNITTDEFNRIIRELIIMNETQKVQEAQGFPPNRRVEWERRVRDYRHGLGSPTSKDQFGDIDERYPNPIEKRPPLLSLPRTWNVGPDDRGRDYDRPARPHGMPGPGGPPFMGMMPQRPIRPGRMGMRPPLRPPWAGGPPGRNLSWKGFGQGPSSMPGPGRASAESHTFPPASEKVLQMIANDTTEETTINGKKAAIRFYGTEAVALTGTDSPREVRFQNGQRDVIFDGSLAVSCGFNQPPREVNIGGKKIWVSLGAPTRELYINQTWYPCSFGGPPIDIELEPGRKTRVQLQGPMPGLEFAGSRTDLIAGIVYLFIDGYNPVQLYLDAKPQRFDIDGVPFVLRFTDALRVITINDKPVNLTFGGPALRIAVNYKDHFIRLSALPHGVKPGEVWIDSMPGKSGLPPPPRPQVPTVSSPLLNDADSTRTATSTTTPQNRPAQPEEPVQDDLEHNPALPMRGRTRKIKTPKIRSNDTETSKQNLNSGLSSLLAPSASGATSVNSYQITDTTTSNSVTSSTETPAASTTSNAGIPFLGSDFNVDDLYQKLVAIGFLKSSTSTAATETKKEETDSVKKVSFDKSETFKVEQPAIVSMLYSGIQCSSCGVRFPPEQTVKYSQHLDWHFRQNRRDKDSQRKPQSRKWYYDVSDWIQFEEIEDLEERAQSWFETQQSEASRPEEVEQEEMESVPAGDCPEGAYCQLCHDKFEQFYNEEKEEWHLRHAVVVEDKIYHPVCYKDYKAALEEKDENAAEGSDENELQEQDEDAGEEEGEKNEDAEMKCDAEVEDEGGDKEEEPDVKVEVKEEPEEPKESDETAVKTEPSEETDADAVPSQSADVEMTELPTVKKEPEDVEMEEQNETEEKEEEKKVEDEMEELSQGPIADTTLANVASNIDGNVEHEDAPQSVVVAPPKIKINIMKAIAPAPVEEEDLKSKEAEKQENKKEDDSAAALAASADSEASAEPPPPGEEPIILKPKLMGRKLVDVPPLSRGSELSGLCSIM